RVPLRPGTNVPPAVVRVAVRHASQGAAEADRGRGGSAGRADHRLFGTVVVHLDVAAINRRAPLRVPQLLGFTGDAPYRGQLDGGAGGVEGFRHPTKPGVVAGAVHRAVIARARRVAGRTLSVRGLQRERVALEAEDVVQREAAAHRPAPLV